MDSVVILKTEISVTSIDEVAEILQQKNLTTVAVCNANSLVRAYRNDVLQKKLNSFTIRVSDGFPVAKASNILYRNKQKRVDGFNILHKTIEKGLKKKTSHYFYGNTEDVTKKLISKLLSKYPNINIAGFSCPPFDTYENLVEQKYIKDIQDKDPDIVWVSLGYPKQEEFINLIKQKKILTSNLIGIGGVFEWVAGTKRKAPELLANLGIEWVFRLIQEPTRLFKRYFIDNLLFIIYFIKQISKKRYGN
tara:strand:+ start:346 stop:1092 length:747 start_codon:yes stop_codon:yes gene_type:complete